MEEHLNERHSLTVALLQNRTIQTTRIQEWIRTSGNECTVLHTAEEFRKALYNTSFDAVLLDWDLMGKVTGLDILIWLRKTLGSYVPVIMTGRSSSEQVVVSALYSGADNFMTQPVRQHELLARLFALVRRTYPSSNVFNCSPYRLDTDNREVRYENELVRLTNLEYELAVFLFRHRGRVLSREFLLTSVWQKSDVDMRTVDTHISKLRAKLKMPDTENWTLSAVYRRGYRLAQHSFDDRCRAA